MTTIASYMKKSGYTTRIVGKWDVGMATEDHHPRSRGYDSWLGYWHHSNDYWQHTEEKCDGTPVRDLWSYNALTYAQRVGKQTSDEPALAYANPSWCSQKNQTDVACVFEEKLFVDEVKAAIEAAASSDKPLFLVWSSHLVHYPLQVPSEYVERFSFIDDENRKLNHAMANYLDDAIGQVVALLKERDMWNNTILAFHSDNGGEIMGAGICGGNNFPLRGGKFSNFEGGIRVNAFISGGALSPSQRGKRSSGLFTIWDFLATYAQGAAGMKDISDASAVAAGLPDIDSLNQWDHIMGVSTSPRNEIFIGETSALTPNGDGNALAGGLISPPYKLLVGAADRLHTISQNTLTGPSWPNSTSKLIPLLHLKTCGRSAAKGCLFNIYDDPSETTSLASQMPKMFESMLQRLDNLSKTVFSPVRGKVDSAACQAAQARNNTWRPFAV